MTDVMTLGETFEIITVIAGHTVSEVARLFAVAQIRAISDEIMVCGSTFEQIAVQEYHARVGLDGDFENAWERHSARLAAEQRRDHFAAMCLFR